MYKILPIGAVVLLEKALVPLMIVGYLPKGIDEKTRDYMGVPYFVGYTSNDSIRAFNHEDIKKIMFRGNENNMLFNHFMNKLYAENAFKH